MNDIATTQRAGSAKVQGDLWNARARDYAEILEGFFRPLYESVLARPEVSQAEVRCSTSAAVPDSRRESFRRKSRSSPGSMPHRTFIEIARERLPGRDFRVAEMETLPHADASFDVITGFNAFQYAASPQAALAEARRVARAGGAIVVATWGLPEDCDAAGHLKALGALDATAALRARPARLRSRMHRN